MTKEDHNMTKEDHKMVDAKIDLGSQCAICPVRGLFPEVCRLHREQMMKRDIMDLSFTRKGWMCWGTKIAAGAGIGLAGAVAGLAVVPAFGAKAVLGHMIGYQIAGAATVAGAGTNFTVQMKNKKCSIPKRKYKSKLRLRKHINKLPYSLSEKGR